MNLIIKNFNLNEIINLNGLNIIINSFENKIIYYYK